ncbi:MAG: phosphotransferase [Lachnospiraceae bacterium]|nr:phosphotransferase [Lachnospiraceae bacterium]
MLTYEAFSVLSFLSSHPGCPYKDPAAESGTETYSYFAHCTEETLSKTWNFCRQNGWLTENDLLTEEGAEQLAPYRVTNAVVMAAGLSSRFAPLSYEKPKGLWRVKGEVLIERQIRQLLEAGISDITVVVGYMKEKFFYLEDKFGVKIVVNEDYYRYNNPSTLMRVLDRLDNTYICSSDNYFTENVFSPYVYRSYYSAVHTDEKTDEYCLYAEADGRIRKVTVGGGPDAWYMLGHVYFSRDFSRRFTEILKREYAEPRVREQLWEQLYMRHLDELDLYIQKYETSVIREFDSLDELRQFDGHYINNTNSAILSHICQVLHCEEREIVDITAIKSGLTNTSFRFTCRDQQYVYRHPGIGTENYICRESEAFSMKIAKKLRLDDTFIYMDKEKGWKLSHYIENPHTLDYHNPEEVGQALRMMRKLHDANIRSEFDFDIWQTTLSLIKKISDRGRQDFEDFETLFQKIRTVYRFTEEDRVEKRLCHCDCYDPNFLIGENGAMYLIDWEYSGNDDPAGDLGTFICCSDYTWEEAMAILERYFNRPLTPGELRHYIAYISIASYYWFIWAIYQESIGNTVGEYLYLWYKGAKFYANKALALYQTD